MTTPRFLLTAVPSTDQAVRIKSTAVYKDPDGNDRPEAFRSTDPNREPDRCPDPRAFVGHHWFELSYSAHLCAITESGLCSSISPNSYLLDQRCMDLMVRHFGDSTADVERVARFDSVKREIDAMGFNELQYDSLGHS